MLVKKTKKKKIGIIVAIEINSIYTFYNNIKELKAPKGFHLYKVEKENAYIYVLKCGMGECASAAGTQFLISNCKVELIINFGVVGGLTIEMKKQKVCLVNRVVHYKYDCSEFMDLSIGQVDGHNDIFLKPSSNLINITKKINPDIALVTCCSGDKFIASQEEKTYLHNTFEGDICDMESSGIVLTCEANDVPCILFKAVSDGLSDGADGFYKELECASLKCLQVVNQIIENL